MTPKEAHDKLISLAEYCDGDRPHPGEVQKGLVEIMASLRPKSAGSKWRRPSDAFEDVKDLADDLIKVGSEWTSKKVDLVDGAGDYDPDRMKEAEAWEKLKLLGSGIKGVLRNLKYR
jgi:hypothetical protein